MTEAESDDISRNRYSLYAQTFFDLGVVTSMSLVAVLLLAAYIIFSDSV
jgi:hypothetical protein